MHDGAGREHNSLKSGDGCAGFDEVASVSSFSLRICEDWANVEECSGTGACSGLDGIDVFKVAFEELDVRMLSKKLGSGRAGIPYQGMNRYGASTSKECVDDSTALSASSTCHEDALGHFETVEGRCVVAAMCLEGFLIWEIC